MNDEERTLCENDLICMIYCIIRKTSKVIINSLLILILSFVAITGYKNIDPLHKGYKYPDMFGFITYNVGSDSMFPTLKTGDLLIMKLTSENTDLKKGDIIAYKSGSATIIHRIHKKVNNMEFITKGDNNTLTDGAPIKRKNIIATKVIRLPHMQKILNVIRTPIGFIMLIVLSFSIFIFSDTIFNIPDIYFRYKKDDDDE